MYAGRLGDCHLGHRKRRVYFNGISALHRVRHVVVAYEDEGRHSGSRQLTHAPCELTLHGRRGVAILEYVPGDEDEVNVILQSPVEGFVERLKEVTQARR